jgi:hypothetical protein
VDVQALDRRMQSGVAGPADHLATSNAALAIHMVSPIGPLRAINRNGTKHPGFTVKILSPGDPSASGRLV